MSDLVSAGMKQPHEDVPRPYADDPLLSLDEAARPYRDALAAMAWNLDTATMVGNPAPIVERMGARIRGPQPGDLVVESSTRYRNADEDHRTKAFGRLVLVRDEWWETHEEWQQLVEEDGGLDAVIDRKTDRAWYVQYGPDHICRWVNCDFVVLPVEMARRDWFPEDRATA